MGSTHREYELQDKKIPVHEVVKDIMLINNRLCIGDDRLFSHIFGFDNLYELERIQSKFKVRTYEMQAHFELFNPNNLVDLLKSPFLFDRISLNNTKVNAVKRDYLHYYMRIDSKGFNVSIVLPISEDLKYIKDELRNILQHLVKKNVIELTKKALEDLVEELIENSLIRDKGHNECINGVEYHSWADFTPKESKQIRSSSIRLKFDEDYFAKNEGLQNATVKFYQSINEYFTNADYKMKGAVMAEFDSSQFNELNKFDFIKLKIPVSLDLNENPNFTYQDLKWTSKSGSRFIIDKFDWLDSEPNFLDNRIYLEIKNNGTWFLQIDIAKQINEEYYFNIELLINKELKYIGMQ